MKKIVFIVFLFGCHFSFSQSKEIEKISFLTIEEAPVYKGCEDFETNSKRELCMNTLLTKHIEENFDFSIVDCLSYEKKYNRKKRKLEKICVKPFLPGEKRIFLNFEINESGKIKDINVKAPHWKLKEEAIRVAKLIPKLTPGKQKGVPTKLNYTHPIDFTVE